MDFEDKIKANLLIRGFTKEQLLNNRGLIGATIDETVLMTVKNIAYEPVLATVLDDPNIVKLCKPNYIAKDGSVKQANRYDDYKNEQTIYYCHKDDLYCV